MQLALRPRVTLASSHSTGASPARRVVALPSRSVRAAAAEGGDPKPEEPKGDGTFYNDERAPPPRTEMSDAYKAKLRKEYLSLGGSPNTAMGGNYFLYIIILVAVLAVITKLSGAI